MLRTIELVCRCLFSLRPEQVNCPGNFSVSMLMDGVARCGPSMDKVSLSLCLLLI